MKCFTVFSGGQEHFQHETFMYDTTILRKESAGNWVCWYNLPTTVYTSKVSHVDNSPRKDSYAPSATEQSWYKTNICFGQSYFHRGLEPPNERCGQFPKRLGRTNTSSFTKDKCFWRVACPSALTVNTRVSGTNVTCDWWGTSGIEGQEGNRKVTLWTETKSLHKNMHAYSRSMHTCAHA